MERTQEINIHERVARLEVGVDETKGNVKKILENHLPHIEAKVDNISNSLFYYSGIGVTLVTVLNIVINIIIKFWK